MQASRWLLTGLTAAAVAGGLVMGDLTASAIDPPYRQVGATDETSLVLDITRTEPVPIAFTPISSVGDWPDAAPPPPGQSILDEPAALPSHRDDEPSEPTLPGPEPVLAMPSEPSMPTTQDQPSPAPTSIPSAVDADQSVESVPPAS